MSVTSTGSAAGIILVILGIWLVLQTLVGNLAARIVNLGKKPVGVSGTASQGAVAGANAAMGPNINPVTVPPVGLIGGTASAGAVAGANAAMQQLGGR